MKGKKKRNQNTRWATGQKAKFEKRVRDQNLKKRKTFEK